MENKKTTSREHLLKVELKHDYLVNRRRFLKQISIGVAGLAITSSSLRIFAANESETTVPEGYPLLNENGLFKPVHYHPIASKVIGLKKNTVSLDGAWQIDPKPGQDIREKPLTDASWCNFQVPGQWAQQGYDIPQDKTNALVREFSIPSAWAGYRIFLRFDAIHGGTNYWLNGKPLGYSENLYTPVEWEITETAKVGQANRLDLEMKVATVSEMLSSSSGYVGYSLGGIDRAVRIYALPRFHVSTMHLNAGLDNAYRDGELQIVLGLDNPDQDVQNGLEVSIQLFDARKKPVRHTNQKVTLDPIKQGVNTVSIESQVTNPLKWNAEQPNLYTLIIVLMKDGKMLERIERHIGFRKIEIKGQQFFVNGSCVKLAGVCHHEIDPLTGRANTMRHAEDDVKLFKSGNLNFARSSHYPPTQEFLDAADRYGLYIESEAPFCWVWSSNAKDMTNLNAILTPTSAMIDYNHSHPSIIMWSVANESDCNEFFDPSYKLCKQLDPTRPTTLDGDFGIGLNTDIKSMHYQSMPYDDIMKENSHPFLHGECFFLVYHERTDVNINPGLREMWGHGSADPASDWGKSRIESLKGKEGMQAGIYPGAWNYIYASKLCIGSEIWSGVDDLTYLPGAKATSCENANAYWGIIDGWRRPKPELYVSKFVFSPIWFPVHELDYKLGQTNVRVPVENRYSFNNLNKFDFVWELGDKRSGKVHINVFPASKGEIDIPIPKGTPEGTLLIVRAIKGSGEIVNAALYLGKRQPSSLPQPQVGAPKWSDDDKLITIEGKGFSLVLDRTTGDFDAANPKHQAPIISFPFLHVTRHDFGDLNNKKPPYAQFPDAKTRIVESITVAEIGNGLELTMKDHYDHFAGTVRWLMDKDGVGKISYDYTYTGDDLDSREIGIKTLLPAKYDEVKWRRWSEWGTFPKDSISRTVGTAKAHRDKKWPEQPANVKPAWPWSQDQTELGTSDFRSIKFCIYEAALMALDGTGVRVNADADAHFRVCLADQGVNMYILSQCPQSQEVLKKGARLTGEFSVSLLA